MASEVRPDFEQNRGPGPGSLPNGYQVLTEKNVRFKRLFGGLLSQAPCPRFYIEALAFPGSKSTLSHILFLSKGILHQQMFLVAYSKLVTFKEFDYERLLFKTAELNSLESSAVWKIERKNGLIFPLLEMTLFPLPAESVTPDLIWRGCGVIDSLFKAKVEEFKGNVEPQDVVVQKQVRTFLEYMGFKKIKDQLINGGISYLVVLSNDDDTDESIWKRFPLKIEVTDLIIYRIYFSIKDAAVTGRKGFINSSKILSAHITRHLNIGHFNYVSATNQLQLVFKMQYKTMSPSDIWQSLRVYYDTIIQYYKWTAPGLVQLYLDVIDCTKSISEVGEYLEKVNDEIQGETIEKVLDYTHDEEDLFRFDSRLLKRITDPKLCKFTLPQPFLIFEKKVRITTLRRLIPLRDYFARFPYTRDLLILKSIELFDILSFLSVFPTLDMLFCSPPPIFELFIIPGKGLHEDPERFLNELMNFVLSEFAITRATLTRSIKDDYLKQQLDSFSVDSNTTTLDLYAFGLGHMGSDKYIFYKCAQGNLTKVQIFQLEQYRSQLSQFPFYTNQLTGWLLASEQDFCNIMDPNASLFFNSYIIERYNYQIWKLENVEKTFLQVAVWVLDLHGMGFFHWFINPFTIRKYPKTQEVVLVLPCLKSYYFDFIHNCIPKVHKKYLAPEVKEFSRTGKRVRDGNLADVFSFCKMLKFSYSKIHSKTMPQNLQKLVITGMSEDPTARPAMEELRSTLETIVKGIK